MIEELQLVGLSLTGDTALCLSTRHLRAVYTSGLDIYDLDLYVKTCV